MNDLINYFMNATIGELIVGIIIGVVLIMFLWTDVIKG
jgi:hypothetical protein